MILCAIDEQRRQESQPADNVSYGNVVFEYAVSSAWEGVGEYDGYTISFYESGYIELTERLIGFEETPYYRRIIQDETGLIPEMQKTITAYQEEIGMLPEYLNNGILDGASYRFAFGKEENLCSKYPQT